MSLKVRQANGVVAYFTPMKDLDSGTQREVALDALPDVLKD